MSSRVAIITRTKNRTIFLRRAMESALAQTLENWNMVVVNDGGDKASVDTLAAEFAKRFRGRIQVIHNETSFGMEAASNKGIVGATSEFLVVLDDDDTWEPKFLETAVGFLDDPLGVGCGGVVTGFHKVFERVEDDRIVEEKREDVSQFMQDISLWQMCGRNCFPTNSFLFRRSCYEAVGPYREDLPVLGDWEFNLRFMQRFDIGQVRRPALANFHHRTNVAAPDYDNSFGGAIDRHQIYRVKIRNEYLRRDLESGRVGLGYAMNLAGQLIDIQEEVDDIKELVLPLHSVSSRIEGLKHLFKRKT